MDDASPSLPLDRWTERYRDVSLPDWKLYSNYRVKDSARATRLVRLVDLARRAEVEGRVQRADFFWRQAHRDLEALRRDDPGSYDADMVRDVFWSTHWALVRGGLQGKTPEDVTPEDRAFAHAAWIETATDALAASSAARESLEAVLLVKVAALERVHRFAEALRAIQALRGLAPEASEYVDRVVAVQMAIVSEELGKGGDDAERQKSALRRGILELSRLRESGPPNLAVLDAEAVLRQALAVRLANTENVSEALLESRKALALDPSVEDGEENFKKLVELMTELQGRMETVRAELRADQELSPIGRRLMDDATRGLGPMERFTASPDAELLGERRMQALAFSVWRSLGLSEPGAEDTGPRQLLEVFGVILRDPPADPSDLEGRWKDAVAGHPDVAHVPPAAAIAYLHRRLFPEDPNAPAAEPRGRAPRLGDGPVIVAAAPRARGDGEPFRGWLYSRTDLRVKAQCALAVGLLLVVLPLGAREYVNREVRAEAYADARQAASAGDVERVMDAAARFVRHGVLAADAREPEMARLYDEALVNWVLNGNPGDEELRRRLATRPTPAENGRTE